MPKETIATYPDDDCTVQVRWGNGVVQVNTAGPDELQTGGEGWFVDLDRAAINRLIKTLRRARDVSYGRDE